MKDAIQHGSAMDLMYSAPWLFFGLGLALFFPANEWPATVGVLMISQAFCGALVWRRFRMTASAVLPDFLTMYLFMQFVNKSLTLLGEVFGANLFENSAFIEPLFRVNPVGNEYRFQAELVFLIATVIFTLTWRRLEGRTPVAVWHEPAPKAMWLTYAAGLGAYAALTSGEGGASLGSIAFLTQLFAIGALATLLGGRTVYGLGQKKMWVSILALIPFYLFAFRTGMKSEVALVSLPILLPIFRRITVNRALFLVGFVGFVVTFVFPFSHAWRQANWASWGGSGGASISAVASQVLSKWDEIGILDTAAESGMQWLSRGSTSEQGGLVMMLAERDGLIGPVLLEGLATIFVPRLLWADKPTYQPGAWFTWYLGFADSPETATTATAMMLPTELYWMFGILGVFCGMSLLAMLYFYIWRFIVRRAIHGLVPMVALFGMLARSADLDNIHIIYAISSPIILVGYVVFIDSIQRVFSFGSLSKAFGKEGKQ